ncbi:MAG TPA: EAL domain-containing protein, partial [Acidimicrobiales bacterium]|nr:EAL domain-containing protein [Acidimicrobiales bacterium]
RHDTSDETLVAAIVSMARALDAVTIAEGVEAEIQEELLRSTGCDMAQGYYYAKPVSALSVPETLRRLSRRRGLRLVSGDRTPSLREP